MAEPWMGLLLAGISCFLGFAWLALAMAAHWQQVMQTTVAPSPKTYITLRISGIAGLLLSAVLCFWVDHPSMAILVWIMLSAAAAPAVGLLLAWKPHLLRWLIFVRLA